MLLFSLILISTELQAAVIAADAEAEGECDNTDKLRLVTMEELETYVTGKFTAEEAAKGLDSISSIQVAAINDWAGFYDKSVKYNFVGLLVDPRFYDEEGKPNQPLIEHQKVAEERQEKDRLWKEKQKQKTPAKKAPAKKTS
jgi:hypothetical protein